MEKELQLPSSNPTQNAAASEKQLSGVKIYIRGPPPKKGIQQDESNAK